MAFFRVGLSFKQFVMIQKLQQNGGTVTTLDKRNQAVESELAEAEATINMDRPLGMDETGGKWFFERVFLKSSENKD